MPPRDIALALFIAVLWGLNFVVMKVAVDEVAPLLLSAGRFGLAGLIGVCFVAKPAVSWASLTAYGALFGIVKFGLLFSALAAGMPSGLAAVALQLQAPFTVLAALAATGERPTRPQALGLGLAVAGLLVIGTGQSGGAALVPFLMVVAAAAAWAAANMVVKRAGAIDMLGFTVWSSLVVPIPMLALSLLFEGPDAIARSWSSLSWIGAGAIAYLVIPVSIVGGAVWNGLLARHPASAVAPFALLVPAIGLAAGSLVLGERLTATVVVGAALIGLGLAAIAIAERIGRGRDAGGLHG